MLSVRRQGARETCPCLSLLSGQELASRCRGTGLQADWAAGLVFGAGFLSCSLGFPPPLALAWQASSPGQDGLAAVQRTPGELMINVIVCNSDRGPLEPACHTQLISPAVLSPFVCSPAIRLPVN